MEFQINASHLPEQQKQLLIGYAQGKTNDQLCRQLHLSRGELKLLELDVRQQLKAQTTPHIISRAWELGMISRCMCLALVLLSSQVSYEPLRQTRLPRTRTSSSVVVRSGNIGREVAL